MKECASKQLTLAPSGNLSGEKGFKCIPSSRAGSGSDGIAIFFVSMFLLFLCFYVKLQGASGRCVFVYLIST